MKSNFKSQKGQSIVIVALSLVVLIALLALVVDAGNAYVQRRKIQNAVDAASEAGNLALGLNKNEGTILSQVQLFVRSNGVSPSDATPYYVVQDGVNYYVTSYTIPYYGSGSQPPPSLVWNGSSLPVVGISVQGTNQFPTYFGGVIGWRTMQVSAAASRTVNKGACSGDTLFPIAVADASFGGFGITPANSYRLYENNPGNPNKFGYLTWNGTSGVTTLVSNMQQYANNTSGTWGVNDSISNADDGSGNVSLSNSSINGAIQTYITSGAELSVPVYDTYTGGKYHVKGFARIKITAYNGGSGNKYIDVQFKYFDAAKGAGGCSYYITSAPGVPGQTPTVRTLIGQVKLQKLTPKNTVTTGSAHVPVDVVNVLDISGSMTGAFGSTTKLQGAKNALTSFNSNMQPSQGDQAGLVTFPLLQSGSSYSYSCTQNGSYSTYYFGQVRNTLTTNITGTNGVNSTINGLSANGGTPLADGIRLGYATVVGAGHQSSHPAVMIIASDGIANIRTNGRWTGDAGTTYENNVCNQPAVQDAIDQANVAKSNGVTIFTIAVGNDFNPVSLQAIASTDTDPSKPHFFQVSDATSMASIYQQIANRIENFNGESCQLIPTESDAGGAVVNFRNNTTGATYQQTTDSAGKFSLPSAPAGTYEFTGASVTMNGVTYSVFTDGPGGPVLSSNPTLPVATGSGTYSIDLALKTTQTVNCP